MSLINEDKQQILKLRTELDLKRQKVEHQQEYLKRHEEELLSRDRDRVEALRTDVDRDRQELDAAWQDIRQQSHQLSLMKNTLDMDRLKLEKQQEQMDTELCELKTRQEQVHSQSLNIHSVREQLRHLSGHTQHKRDTIQQHIKDMDTLCVGLQQQLTALDQDKVKMDDCTQLLRRQQDALKDTLSHTAELKQMEQQLLLERLHVDKLRTEVKQQKQELDQERDQMKRDKVELQQMRTGVHRLMDKLEQSGDKIQKAAETLFLFRTELQEKTANLDCLLEEIKIEKSNMKDIQTQRDQLKHLKSSVVLKQQEPKQQDQEALKTLEAEREQLEQRRKELNLTREENNAVMVVIRAERQQLDQMRTQVELEKQTLLDERTEMDLTYSELQKKENEFNNNISTINALNEKLQQQKERINEEIKCLLTQMKRNNQDIKRLFTVLQQSRSALEEQKENMVCYRETVEKVKAGLTFMLSDISRRKGQEHEPLASQTLSERENLNRDRLQRESLEVDIHKQLDTLAEGQQYIKNEKDRLEDVMARLTEKTEQVENLFKDIITERNQIKALAHRVQLKHTELQEAVDIITLKQEEEPLQETSTRTRIEELKESRRNLQTERKKLEELKKEVDRKREEAEAATSLIDEEKQQLHKLNKELDTKRQEMERQQDDMKQQELSHKELETQCQELHSSTQLLKEERQQVEDLRKDLDRKTQEAEAAMSLIDEEKQRLQENRRHLEAEKEQLEMLKKEVTRKREEAAASMSLINEDKQQILKLRTELDLKRQEVEHQQEYLKRHEEELLSRDRDRVEALRTDVDRDRKELDAAWQDIREQKHQLSLMKNTLDMDRLKLEKRNDEIKREKDSMKDVALQPEKRRASLGKMIQERNLTQELTDSATPLLEEKPELLGKRKDDSDTGIDNIRREKQQLIQVRAELAQEREMFFSESKQRDKDLKLREEGLRSKMTSIENLSARLKQLTQQKSEAMGMKIIHLEANHEHVLKLSLLLEQMCTDLEQHKHTLSLYSQTLQRENITVTDILSNIYTRPVEVELKTETRLKALTLEKATETEHDFDIQTETFQKHKQDIKTAKYLLENTLEELQCNKDKLASVVEEISREKDRLKDVAATVQTGKDHLEKVLNELQLNRCAVKAHEQEQENIQCTQQDNTQREQINQSAVTERKEKDDSERDLKVLLHQFAKQMNEKTSTIMSKIKQLELNKVQTQKVCTVLEQKLSELTKLKQHMAGYTKVLEKEKSTLINILSDLGTKRSVMSDKPLYTSILEKQDAEKLKTERQELDTERVTMNKEKEDLELLKSDIHKQMEILQKVKRDVEDERDEVEIRKTELLNLMKKDTASQKEMLANLMTKVKQQCKRADSHMEESIQRVELKNEHILQLSVVIEQKCVELEKLKHDIVCYYDMMQREKRRPVILKCDKAIRTEASGWRQERSVGEQDVRAVGNKGDTKPKVKSDVRIQTEGVKLEVKKYDPDPDSTSLKTVEEDLLMKSTSLSESIERLIGFAADKISKKEYLRQLWKDTNKERKEIDQMKQRGQELKINLETRIKTISKFVKRPCIPREQSVTIKQDTEGDKDNTCQREHGRDPKMTDNVQEKHRTLNTCDKANQTSHTNIFTEAVQVTRDDSASEGAGAEGDASSGLLCQIRHYCYSCCCPCCACCNQVCPDNI